MATPSDIRTTPRHSATSLRSYDGLFVLPDSSSDVILLASKLTHVSQPALMQPRTSYNVGQDYHDSLLYAGTCRKRRGYTHRFPRQSTCCPTSPMCPRFKNLVRGNRTECACSFCPMIFLSVRQRRPSEPRPKNLDASDKLGQHRSRTKKSMRVTNKRQCRLHYTTECRPA